MTTIAIFGSRGYLGRELVRILHHHPEADTLLPVSSSTQGSPYSTEVPGFHGIDTPFVDAQAALDEKPDVVFFATPDAEAEGWAPKCGDATVVDLSRAHRLEALRGGEWTYGLADLDPVPKGTKRIANPGCYPTASLLAALPALRAGLARGSLIADGKSGVTGAGATPNPAFHYAATNESARAYKVLGHDHQAEIGQAARNSGDVPRVRFTPHLVPMNRGLLSTVYLESDASSEELKEAYAAAYADSFFVHAGDEPCTGNVRFTNHAEVAVDVDDGILVARGAIDNLVKGGSGQAVQNMNTALGFEPQTGLTGLGGAP